MTRQKELDDFLAYAHQYDNLIVQSLVGNSQWSSSTQDGTFYHVGTVPDRRMRTFVADLRMMVCSTPAGFMPVALYARRSRKPLQDRPDENHDGARWNVPQVVPLSQCGLTNVHQSLGVPCASAHSDDMGHARHELVGQGRERQLDHRD